MADNNRNWNNQYQQSNNNWDRNRFEDEDRERDDYRYRNTGYGSNYENQSLRGGWNNSRNDNDWNRQNEGRNSGAYSSDYGYQNQGYDQSNWGSSNKNQNWQNSGNQSQQWREQDRRMGNQGSNYGQEEWRRRNVGNEYGNSRNENQDWNQQSYGGNNRDRQDYNDRYRNTGYGESTGMTGGYSNRDNRRHDDNWINNDRRNEGDRGWWDRTTDEVSSWFGDDEAESRRRIDKMSGPHRGKGPRDYHRSEERIREDVCHRLYEDDRVDASDIKVDIQKDEVILSGTVNSREEKRRAEDVVESIYGVRNVENRIRVADNYNDRFDRYTGTTSDAGGVGRESGTTNEVIRNTSNEKNKNK